MNKPRILFLDIEILADMNKVREIFFSIGDWPGRTMKANINSVICFGYKWLGEGKTECLNAWDYKSWRKDINDDKALLQDVIEIINQADAVVFHYGDGFDWPFLETRLAVHNLSILPKINRIDTKKILKNKYFMYSNSLKYAAEEFLGIKKKETGGIKLWTAVSKRDKKAQKLMSEYCKQDVRVLEKLYLKLRPHITNVPNHNAFRKDGAECCPNCGGFNLMKDGYRLVSSTWFQKLACQDCGTPFKTPSDRKLGKIPKVLK